MEFLTSEKVLCFGNRLEYLGLTVMGYYQVSWVESARVGIHGSELVFNSIKMLFTLTGVS